MLLLKLTRSLLLNYGKRCPSIRFMATNINKPPPKATTLRQELIKNIKIDPHINIICEIPLSVTSCNPFIHKDGKNLHAKLFSDPGKRRTQLRPKKLTKRQKQMGCKIDNDPVHDDAPCMQVCVSKDLNNVDIILNKKNCAENAHCVIEVPIFADVHIESFDNVEVSRLNCKDVIIEAVGNIHSQQLRCQKEVILHSKKGYIRCDHVLMGSLMDLETKKDKGIFVDVAMGVEMLVKTTDGDITTNCVYALHSKFETKNGYLRLKNVHKDTEVFISENGFLKMIGARAQMNLCCGDGGVNLQLAYALGNSRISCNESTAKICISDKLAKSVELLIDSKQIKLDNSLKRMQKFVNKDNTKLEHKVKNSMTKDKLTISSKGVIELCELMWIDKLISYIKNKQAKASQEKKK